MPTLTTAPAMDQVVILPKVSWKTYKQLSAETPPGSGVRLTFDQGCLQIMSLSSGHEMPNRHLADLVNMMTELLDLEVCPVGSTTFEREDLARAFEPDSAFYFRSAARMAANDNIRLPHDPPPDLVIEVDISRRSLNKLPLFAAVGIEEVWRYDGGRVHMYLLNADGAYDAAARSRWLAPLTPDAATGLLHARRAETRLARWRQAVRDWFDATSSAARD